MIPRFRRSGAPPKIALEDSDSRLRMVVAGDVGKPHLPDHRGQLRSGGSAQERPLQWRKPSGAPAGFPSLDGAMRRLPKRQEGVGAAGPRRRAANPASSEEHLRVGNAGHRRRALYAHFGHLGTYCFDMAGKPLWSKTWPPYATRYGWGTASSPVLHEGRLYLVNDNDENSFLVALDKTTGEEIWRFRATRKVTGRRPTSGKTEAHGNRHLRHASCALLRSRRQAVVGNRRDVVDRDPDAVCEP